MRKRRRERGRGGENHIDRGKRTERKRKEKRGGEEDRDRGKEGEEEKDRREGGRKKKTAETLNRCVKPLSAFLLGNARSGASRKTI